MKKTLVLVFIVMLAFVFGACGGSNTTEEPNMPPDLSGNWKQSNSDSEDAWQAATIEGGTITISWITDSGETESLYWAGTFVAPTEAVDEYTWTSENDKDKTDMALLASGDDTKEFTYKDGVISYKVSALGTTTTVKLKKNNE